MAEIVVDGKAYPADPSQNLLEACLGLGFDLPYFCWHPALRSVGACRQCAVKQYKDETDTAGKLVMACMVPAKDGTILSIDDAEARAFRASVIEWLMIGHPHDCPVCEEGGECHLQDMTVMAGHAYRRYRFAKRTFRNQYLGPFLGHEMNRCIACYRCVRFYREYAGGTDLDAFGAHHHVFFGRAEDGVLESEFSGNLAEVCPTGVFTDKTLGESYTRKWDLTSAPSVCVHCSLGCNTFPNERYGELRRILNRYHGAINGYFLCDRGRFGYGFVNSGKRLTTPRMRRTTGGAPAPISAGEAITYLSEWLKAGAAVGIGSPRASLEANHALKTAVGAENFYRSVPAHQDRLVREILAIYRDGPAPAASISDAEASDAVLVLGEDVPDTAPRLALALRQSVRHAAWEKAEAAMVPLWQDKGVRETAPHEFSPLFIAAPAATRLDDVATESHSARPDEIALLGFAVAQAIDPDAPDHEPEPPPDTRRRAEAIAEALMQADRPLVVSGTGCGSLAVIQAAANVARALSRRGHPARLCYALPACNSAGFGLMEAAGTLDDALARLGEGGVRTALVLEADLDRLAGRERVEAALAGVPHVVALDHLAHAFAERADLALPAAAFAEATGTLVNNEGRAQRYFSVHAPPGEAAPGWRWLKDAMALAGRNEAADWSRLDDLTAACATAEPPLARITEAAPGADARIAGMPVARQPHRMSGRTAMHADRTVFEPPPPADPDAPLSPSMEGYYGPKAAPATLPFAWAAGWDSEQAVNKFQQEIAGPTIGGDAGVRLIDDNPDARPDYFPPPAAAPAAADHDWPVVPLHHVFGSEELSAEAAAVRELCPAPYVALRAEDAERLGAIEGAPLRLAIGDRTVDLPAAFRPDLPPGTLGLPAGLPGTEGLVLPARARLVPS